MLWWHRSVERYLIESGSIVARSLQRPFDGHTDGVAGAQYRRTLNDLYGLYMGGSIGMPMP